MKFDGIETTRTGDALLGQRLLRISIGQPTSEPVAMITAFGAPAQSLST
jgi:hypothetical protein